MRPNLAQPVFNSGPQNQFATMDPLSAALGSGLNNIQDLAKKFDVDLGSLMRGGLAAAQSLPLFTTKGSGFPLNKENFTSRLLSSVKDISTYLRQAQQIPGFTSNTYNAYKNNDEGQVFAKMGDLIRRVSYTDFKSMNDIGYFINDLSRQLDPNYVKDLFGVDDQDGYTALAISTIQEATRFGIPNSFSAVVATLENSSMVERVINGTLPIAVDHADLNMLSDMAKSTGKGNLKFRMPDIIERTSRNYQPMPGATYEDRIEDFKLINSTFDEIDPGWNDRIRGDRTLPDITKMLLTSPEFKETMLAGARASTDEDLKHWLIADKYQNQDVYTSLKNDFPLTVLSPDGNNPQTDPRYLNNVQAFPVNPNPPINTVF